MTLVLHLPHAKILGFPSQLCGVLRRQSWFKGLQEASIGDYDEKGRHSGPQERSYITRGPNRARDRPPSQIIQDQNIQALDTLGHVVSEKA